VSLELAVRLRPKPVIAKETFVRHRRY